MATPYGDRDQPFSRSQGPGGPPAQRGAPLSAVAVRVVNFLGLRRARGARNAQASPAADEQAVLSAEMIVNRAWAEELLRQHDVSGVAVDAARAACQAVSDRLVVAQRYGDPRQISSAHAALERAVEVHRASEATREQVRQALEAALDVLTSGRHRRSQSGG
jgi:hypothetical protein